MNQKWKNKQNKNKAKTTTTTKQTSKENQTLTSMILYISNDLTMQNLSQKQFMFFYIKFYFKSGIK